MSNKIKELDEQIDKVRETLNKVSLGLQNTEDIEEILNVSRSMDKLIVEYMKSSLKIS